MQKIHIIIPARYASSRLPGKLMMILDDKPLIGHTIAAAKEYSDNVIVATDNKYIFDYAVQVGVTAIMTSEEHLSGTDRIAEATNYLSLDDKDIVVNLQGDEPLLPHVLLGQVAGLLQKHPSAGIATLMQEIESLDDFCNPNVVKVVLNEDSEAMYFSRAQIPFDRDGLDKQRQNFSRAAYRHIGLYAYRVGVLKEITQLPEHPLERIEKLEQLRPLANGIKIVSEVAKVSPNHGVDTIEDFERLQNYLVRK